MLIRQHVCFMLIQLFIVTLVTYSSNQQAGRIFQSDASMQQMSTVSHLENQLASSLALKSASEYCFWLETYIRYLAQEGKQPDCDKSNFSYWS